MSYQILFIDSQIVFDGGAIVFTDDAGNCECCESEIPPCGNECSTCSDGPPQYITATVSGVTNTGCSDCATLNGTFILTCDPANNCCYKYASTGGPCGLGIYISVCLSQFNNGSVAAVQCSVGVDGAGNWFNLNVSIGPSTHNCKSYSRGPIASNSYSGAMASYCSRIGATISIVTSAT